MIEDSDDDKEGRDKLGPYKGQDDDDILLCITVQALNSPFCVGAAACLRPLF
jgi:hypothetical protein